MNGARRRQAFYTELAKLVDAGFGIRESARVMLDQRLSKADRELLGSMLAGLDEGRSIAGAFAKGGVSRMECGLIEAGERSGKPGQAFAHLADYFGLISEARREVGKAMVYPLVLLHFGLLLAAIPTGSLLEGIDGSEVLMRLLAGLGVTWAILIGGTLLVAWMLLRAPTSRALDRFLNAIPILGSARRNLAMARFTRAYHAGLLAALPMRETLRLAGEASHSPTLAGACRRLEKVVAEGNAIGPAMAGERAFPKSFARSYAIAEESGTLDDELERWSKLSAAESTASVRRVAAVLPKVGYALIVAFVAWRVLSAAAGYYGALESIGA